jgi:competence protein ComEC
MSSWKAWQGRVQVRSYGWTPTEGDRVEIAGRLSPLTDLPGYPQASLMRRQGVTQEMQLEHLRLLRRDDNSGSQRRLARVREWIQERIATNLEEQDAGLLNGLIVGGRGGLSPELRSQFAQTGTSHIVAVSGFNVVIVAGFTLRLLRGVLGSRAAACAALLAIFLYTLVVGAPPSATRAALMGSASLLAMLARRPADSLNGLLLAGALMVLVEPFVILDLGFQLSMLATAGLMLLSPGIERALRPLGRLAGAVAIPLAAQIATLPLILHVFHTFSLIAVVANVLIAPLIPVAMALGALLVVVSGFNHLAVAVAWLAWIPVRLILEIVHACASLPGASVSTGSAPLVALVASYGALWAWMLRQSSDLSAHPLVRRGCSLVACIGGLLALLVPMAQMAPPGSLRGEVHEHVPMTIMHSPSGKLIAIGSTTSPALFIGSIVEHLPFWKRTVDVLILTETSPSIWRSVQALSDRYSVDVLLSPAAAPIDQSLNGVQRIMSTGEGLLVDFGDGLILETGPPFVRSNAEARLGNLLLRYGAASVRFQQEAVPVPGSPQGAATLVVSRGAGQRQSVGVPGSYLRFDANRNTATSQDASDTSMPLMRGRVRFESDGLGIRLSWLGCAGLGAVCETEIGPGRSLSGEGNDRAPSISPIPA